MQLGAGWAQASAAAAVVGRSAPGSDEAESQTDRKLRRVRDPPVQTTALLLLDDAFHCDRVESPAIWKIQTVRGPPHRSTT